MSFANREYAPLCVVWHLRFVKTFNSVGLPDRGSWSPIRVLSFFDITEPLCPKIVDTNRTVCTCLNVCNR